MDVSFTIPTLIVGLLVLVILYYINKSTFKNLPPSPKGQLLLGNLNLLLKPLLYIDLVTKWKNIYPNYVTLWSFRKPIVILNDYKKTYDLFVNDYPIYSSGRPEMGFLAELNLGGKDIFMSNIGPYWNFKRKLIHSALRKFAQHSELERLTKNAFKQFKKLIVQNCEKNADEGLFPYEECHYLSYNITSPLVFGKVFQYNDSEYVSLRQNMESINKFLNEDFFILMIPFIHKVPIFAVRNLRSVAKLVLDYIIKHIEQHQSSGQFYKCPKDIIDFILKENEEYNKAGNSSKFTFEISHFKQTLLDIFTAGADTSGVRLCWMLGILANNKEVMCKVRNEVLEVEEKEGREISILDKQKMPYTQAVLNEMFRYTSVAPMGAIHEMTGDGHIDQYSLPKGTKIMFNVYGFHFDPKYWVEPNKFNPDRFLENGNLIVKKDGLMPFGCGKRVCLGESVAKNKLLLLLALICKELDITWCSNNKYSEIKERANNSQSRYPDNYYVIIKESKEGNID